MGNVLELAVLREALASRFPSARIDAVRWERIGEGFGLASEIYRGHLSGQDVPESVVAKLWNTDGPGGTREASFFEAIATRLRSVAPALRLPECYFAKVDEEVGHGCLVMQDFAGFIQGDCLQHPRRDEAVALAKQLAELHAAGANDTSLLDHDWIPSTTRHQVTPEWIDSRRREFLALYSDRLDPFAKGFMARLEEEVDRARSILAPCPSTLLHGDFHFDNVILDPTGGTPVILDWARICRGPAALEIAELLFAVSSAEDADAARSAYDVTFDECRSSGASVGAEPKLLGAALVFFFVTSTCGVARWTPGTKREEDLIATGIDRAVRALSRYRGLVDSLTSNLRSAE